MLKVSFLLFHLDISKWGSVYVCGEFDWWLPAELLMPVTLGPWNNSSILNNRLDCSYVGNCVLAHVYERGNDMYKVLSKHIWQRVYVRCVCKNDFESTCPVYFCSICSARDEEHREFTAAEHVLHIFPLGGSRWEAEEAGGCAGRWCGRGQVEAEDTGRSWAELEDE